MGTVEIMTADGEDLCLEVTDEVEERYERALQQNLNGYPRSKRIRLNAEWTAVFTDSMSGGYFVAERTVKKAEGPR